jgi:hypothetical protein
VTKKKPEIVEKKPVKTASKPKRRTAIPNPKKRTVTVHNKKTKNVKTTKMVRKASPNISKDKLKEKIKSIELPENMTDRRKLFVEEMRKR